MVLKAHQDVWSPFQTIYDLINIVEGIVLVTERLIHPSLIYIEDLRALVRLLRTTYFHNSDQTNMEILYAALLTRLTEHAP